MYCPECGKYNEENARFCRFCGARMEDNAGMSQAQTPLQQETQNQNMPPQNRLVLQSGRTDSAAGKRKKRKRLWLIPTAVLVIAAAAAMALLLWILPQQKEKKYAAHISEGNHYLEEMDYEKAEDSYLAAIEIEPKEPEPYLRLADIYEIREEPEKAAAILKQGAENTDSPEIREKYDLYTYVQEVLIPEEGQAREGEYTCTYINGIVGDSSVWTKPDPVHSEKGVLTSRIRDYDNDGKDELLVVMLDNDAGADDYTGVSQNEILLRMYECRDGEVVLSDEESVLSPVLGAGDAESSGIFLHEFDGQTYICGSLRLDSYIIADGVTVDSFVMIYGGGKFEQQAGTDEPVAGSEFSGEQQDAEEMAEYLDNIGLPREAEQIRDSWLRCFEFTDNVEMLVLITGENNLDGYPSDYWDTLDTGELGQVLLTLKTTWDVQKPAEDEKDTDESADVRKTAEEVQKTYDYILENGEYNQYISEWLTGPESYSVLDINQDQIPELMVHSADDGTGWSNTLLYAYDPDRQAVTIVQDIYHYSDIRYSSKNKAIVYSDVRSSLMFGGQGFFVLDGAELAEAFSVGWDNTEYAGARGKTDENHYFIYIGDSKKEITEAENDQYFDELTEIEKITL